jgi:type VI secretion system protein ImpH
VSLEVPRPPGAGADPTPPGESDETARIETARIEAARIEAARIEVARRRGLLPLLVLLDRLQPGAADVGGEVGASAEQVRFRHDPTLEFAPGDVARVEERRLPPDPGDFTSASRRRWEIVTTFLGLTGTVSPIPQYLSEEIVQQPPDERASQDFLDLFHHRAISLLARGLLEHDPAATHLGDLRDAWSTRLLALLGVDPSTRPGPETEPRAEPAGLGDVEARYLLLRCAALMAERAPTAAGIEAVLRDALREELEGAPLALEQFVGVRVPIAAPDRTRVGSQACTLGSDAVLGQTVLDRTGTVGVVIGPVGRSGYERFTVERGAAEKLRATLELVGRGELSCAIELLLEPGAAPPMRLAAAGGSRLGRDAWLGGQQRPARIPIAP